MILHGRLYDKQSTPERADREYFIPHPVTFLSQALAQRCSTTQSRQLVLPQYYIAASVKIKFHTLVFIFNFMPVAIIRLGKQSPPELNILSYDLVNVGVI